MHAVISPRDAVAVAPVLQRARGKIRACFRRAEDGQTRLADLFQEGCLKARLPRAPGGGEASLAVMNTAGGLTGGDRLSLDIALGDGARATVTTPACERIYRSIAGDAVVDQHLRLGRDARLDWIPQETILFDRSRLRRRLDVQLEPDAEITVAEAVLFGRAAMGESMTGGFFSDFWTIRRGGSLLFADATRIAEPFGRAAACLATLDGLAATASLLHVGKDPSSRLDELRAAFARAGNPQAGASIVGEVLVVRIMAESGAALRRTLIPALSVLRASRPLPRLWSC